VVEPKVYEPPLPPGKAKIPLFALPVILVLPFFAFFYAHGFQTQPKPVSTDPLVRGAEVYRTIGCSGCHGANGEGGVGPVLHDGAATKTFPNVADHIAWVKTGSAPFQGQKYGDPNRPGGQHGPATGAMPAFAGQLSDAQIAAVVQYEREKL
jgi:mono/diheme cytochrome c family protein